MMNGYDAVAHYWMMKYTLLTILIPFCSIHLFFVFPNLEEGGLATYRAAIVQNQHLTVLAKVQTVLVTVVIHISVNQFSNILTLHNA